MYFGQLFADQNTLLINVFCIAFCVAIFLQPKISFWNCQFSLQVKKGLRRDWQEFFVTSLFAFELRQDVYVDKVFHTPFPHFTASLSLQEKKLSSIHLYCCYVPPSTKLSS